jgi:hypothetical protein
VSYPVTPDEIATGRESPSDAPTDDPRDPSRSLLWVVVFPHPHDLPASIGQPSVGVAIALPVACDLRRPVPPIDVMDPAAVYLAAMPEAAIDEDSDASPRERNVDLASLRPRYKWPMKAVPKPATV